MKKALLLMILLLLTLSMSFRNEIVLTGRITVKGNDPHTKIILITDKNESFELQGKLLDTLYEKYQNEIITVYGYIVNSNKGPGTSPLFYVERIKP